MPNFYQELLDAGVTSIPSLIAVKQREKDDALAAQAADDAAALAQAVADERARAVAILQLPETEAHLAIAIQAVSDGTSVTDAQALMQA